MGQSVKATPRQLLEARQGFVRLFVMVQRFYLYHYWIGFGFDSRHAHQLSLERSESAGGRKPNSGKSHGSASRD
jgi:hypothetical protein